jgi:hypothetical protein
MIPSKWKRSKSLMNSLKNSMTSPTEKTQKMSNTSIKSWTILNRNQMMRKKNRLSATKINQLYVLESPSPITSQF